MTTAKLLSNVDRVLQDSSQRVVDVLDSRCPPYGLCQNTVLSESCCLFFQHGEEYRTVQQPSSDNPAVLPQSWWF